MHSELIIRGRQVVLPGNVEACSLHIAQGRLQRITAYEDISTECELIEVSDDSVLMPGLVDTHVHVNEPGRTSWEGFATATRSAAAGGVTTIVDMPLNSIPATTSLGAFHEKIAVADTQCEVDTAFWGGVVPGNTSELAPMYSAGVVGFKCFLIPSGVDEFPCVTEADLRCALPELKRLGALLIVHAELPGPIEQAVIDPKAAHNYETFLHARPRAAENEAIALMVRLAREFDTRVHIVHHSSADALPLLREARAAGVQITAETCPHYLFFAAEEIGLGATQFKCCPPIREVENREQLWQALAEGTLQMIVSDHSPCPPEMKRRDTGNFLEAWGGISSLQLRLPVVWTAARTRGHSLLDLAEWLCAKPARLVGLDGRKGSIAVGNDADLVVWKPDQEFTVAPEMIHHRHKLSPYTGRVLAGTVQKTFVRGRKIYDEGAFAKRPEGALIISKTR